jgi:hypothetical protein
MDRQMTQAWMWLTAGALAAAMNAVYHDGSMDRVREMSGQIADQVVSRVLDRSEEFVARATGRAERILAAARMTVGRRDEVASARMAEAMPRLEAELERRRDEQVARVEVFTAHQQAHIARLEQRRALMAANGARIEERVSRIQFSPMVGQVRIQPCQRIRVSVPKIVVPKIEVPEIHVDNPNGGPI